MMKAKYIILILGSLFLFSFASVSQTRKLQNQPYIDQRNFHFGFTLGIHTQDLILTQSGYVSENGEVWFSEIPSYSPGFNVGIIGDLYLNEYMNLRVIPTLYLGSKEFVFREQTSGEEFKSNLKSNFLSLPVQLKIAAGRINNYRPYLLLGGYGNMELARKKGDPILLKPADYGIEIGFGCDFYFPLFKLCPELKFSFGLTDVLEEKRPDLTDNELLKYPRSLSKATQRLIVLSFNFE